MLYWHSRLTQPAPLFDPRRFSPLIPQYQINPTLSATRPFPQQRHNYLDRINDATDDFAHLTRGKKAVAGWGCPRVSISMAELRSFGDGSLSQQMRLNPLPHFRALEAALHSVAVETRPGYDKEGECTPFDIDWLENLEWSL